MITESKTLQLSYPAPHSAGSAQNAPSQRPSKWPSCCVHVVWHRVLAECLSAWVLRVRGLVEGVVLLIWVRGL